MKDISNEPVSNVDVDTDTELTAKSPTPLRCFISSIISGVMAYGLSLLLNSIVQTYATKTVTSNNPAVINITSAVRTMIMGIVALGTGVFTLVAIGIFLLGIQLTVQSLKKA